MRIIILLSEKKMKKFGNKIVKIIDMDATVFRVGLKFNGGAYGSVSLEHLFQRPKGLAAEILKGNIFDKCFIESGALAWPNGFELCPDAMRQLLEEERHCLKKAA